MPTAPDPKTLEPAAMVDSDHPAVVAFARQRRQDGDAGDARQRALEGDARQRELEGDARQRELEGDARQRELEGDARQRAVALYYAVRDGFRYDPYRIDLSVHGMKGSTVLANGYGWCVPKAALLAAACRAAGIPARVGYADVRNHLSTERLRRSMGSDLFVWHGYTDIWIDGQWLKATPAFNLELCERFGLLPLEFDGRSDSVYHPFDRAGKRHMEYVAMHGAFDDVPLQRILAAFAEHYPNMPLHGSAQRGDFAADAAAERAGERAAARATHGAPR